MKIKLDTQLKKVTVEESLSFNEVLTVITMLETMGEDVSSWRIGPEDYHLQTIKTMEQDLFTGQYKEKDYQPIWVDPIIYTGTPFVQGPKPPWELITYGNTSDGINMDKPYGYAPLTNGGMI